MNMSIKSDNDEEKRLRDKFNKSDMALWVWLTLKFHPGTKVIPALLEEYGNIRAIYDEKKYTYLNLSYDDRRVLMDKNLEPAYDVCVKTAMAGAWIMTYDDDDYPSLLRNISDPPYVLYAKGSTIDWDNYLLIGVVGSRHCTPYGMAATKKIAGELAEKGIVIVSGLAMGLDAAASIEALRYNRYSIGILGCAIDKVYPASNKILYDAVQKTGLILSEYPPGVNPGKIGFPMRNRIIAGISSGILVTEAAQKSGTNITVNYAYEYSRDVFAVPGSIFSRNSAGTNRLLMGSAKAATCAQDIIEEYPYVKLRQRAPMGNIYIDDLPEIEMLIGKIYPKDEFDPMYKNMLDYYYGSITIDMENELKSSESSSKKRTGAGNGKKSNKTTSSDVQANAASDDVKTDDAPKNEHKEINIDDFEGVQRVVVEALLKGEKQKDDLIRDTGSDAGDINTALIMLEVEGVVKLYPGNIYRLE